MRQAGRLLATGILAAAALGTAPAAAKSPTKARSTAFAKAVNLGAADVAGFTGKVSKPSATDHRLSEMLARCAGSVDPSKDIVDIRSPDFSLAGAGAQDVASEVSVLPSAHLVAVDLAAVKSPKGRACLTKETGLLLASMKTPGVTYGKLTLTTLKRSAPGSDGSFAYRFRVNATAGGVKVPFFLDTLGFGSGPAEIGLTTLGVGQPFPAADEQRLWTLLAGRASFNRI
jgi:hypothetical protein